MKLTLFALLLGISAVFASSANSQTARVNIEANDIQAKEIIQQIEQQTDYLFVYNHANVDLSQKVSMQTTDTPVAEILTTLFATSDILYAMEGNNILLMKRNERLQTQQNRKTVNGIVTDQWGEPLMGVSVSIKESAYGTITDIDGHYSMEVENENTILVFSFIGFNTKEQVVGNRSHLNITLEENIQEIDEVVVIGYGTVKKSDLTGAVSHIKSEELLKRPTVDVSQALQGKFAGVDVTQNSGIPGGEVRIRVRGDNSISSSSDPLWVVDGIVGIWNSANINPNDIETIEILKDASATAIYGARGANGVIMVTTKRGISGKPIVNYDGYLSVAKLSNKVDLLNASEFMQVYNQSFDNAAKYDPEGYAAGKYKRNMPENYPDLFHADGTPSYDTDWQDEVYRTAVGQNHQFSVRGGSDKVRYGTFLGVTLQPGIMDRSDYKRYTGKVTLDNDLTDWLTLSSFVSVNYTRKNMSREDLGVSRLTMEALPILPVQFEDGRYSTQTDFLGWEQENPVKRLYQTEDVKDIYQTMASIAANIKFTKDLTLNTSFSVDLGSSKENYYSGRDLNLISASQNGIAEITSRRELYWQNENYLTYDKYFNNIHHLTVMAGLSWQERYWERAVSKSENFIDDFYQWHNLGVGTVLKTPESEDERWRINSYFSRINYVIAEKYLFTLTGRVDGSSKFGKNNKYAFFPSAAVAWRISQEEFLKENDWISNLKLRTSVGITGNQEIGIYKSLQLLETGQVILGDQYQTGLYKGTFGNRDLKWEKTTQYDVGLDLGLFNQRINLTADYYHKTTRDLLLETPLPYSSGMDKVMTNIGSLRNTGVELSIQTINIKQKELEWSTALNWSKNKNKILKLGADNEDIFPGPNHQLSLSVLRVGESIGSFWGYVREGIWREDEAEEAARYNLKPGDVKHADLNNDGVINEQDETIIGKASPDWTMNFSSTIRWKNFDLSFDLRWVYGAQVYNTTRMTTEDRSTIANNQSTVLNAWTPDNQNTMITERRPTSIYYNNKPDSRKVEGASFLRGQNFVLGYTLPKSMTKKWYMEKLRIYASAQNLFCITGYSGYDPEIRTYPGYDGNVFAQNMDFYGYPKPRTFTFGLNVTF